MAHAVETMFAAGARPWHGLGNLLPENLTTPEAIKAAGLDWTVALAPVMAALPDGPMGEDGQQGQRLVAVPDRFATVRSSDDKVLGVVGSAYRPLQNVDAFAVLDALVTEKEAVWETAGSLFGGRAVWALAKLPGDIVVKRPGGKADPVSKYLLITNRHDGTAGVNIKLTPIRVVCANTLAMALQGGAFLVRHTQTVEARVKAAHEALGLANKHYAELGELYNRMAKAKLDDEGAQRYFRGLLRKAPTEAELSEADAVEAGDEKDALAKRLNALLGVYEGGRGVAELKTAGTVWGAYNAVTEWVDHHKKFRNDSMHDANALGIGGDGAALKVRAFNAAVTLSAK